MDIMEFMRNQQDRVGQGRHRCRPASTAAPMIKVLHLGHRSSRPSVALLVAAPGADVRLPLLLRAANVTFKQAFTIVTWAFLIVSLVTVPLWSRPMALKGDWNEDPATVARGQPHARPRPRHHVQAALRPGRAIDLFAFWLIWLLAAGFGVLIRKPTGSALWGVVIPWLIVVLIAVGWAAIF